MITKARAKPQVERFASRDEWLAARRGWIGGSDIAAVVGANPHDSACRVYAEKIGATADEATDAEDAFWGRQLEEAIGRGFADRHNRLVTRPKPISVYSCGDYPGKATPDFFQAAAPEYLAGLFEAAGLPAPAGQRKGVLQIKNVKGWAADQWTDDPPLYYQLQLQHEMAATGCQWGTLAALLGGYQIRFFDAVIRPDIVAKLASAIAWFQDCVARRELPAVDATAACARALAELHPRQRGGLVIDLPEEFAAIDARLQAVKADLKALQAEERELENRIKAAMGDAALALLPGSGAYQWRVEPRAGHTVKPSEPRILRRKAGL